MPGRGDGGGGPLTARSRGLDIQTSEVSYGAQVRGAAPASASISGWVTR